MRWALILIILVVAGCTSGKEDIPMPRLSSADSSAYRESTFLNCSHIMNATVFRGKVMFEECGKNGLGGYPNSGPYHCFYALIDEDGCYVYVRARIDAMDDERFKSSERLYREHGLGENVKAEGNMSVYYPHYCGEEPRCAYFVIGDVW